MSKVDGIKCDICEKMINYGSYFNSSNKHYIFPFGFRAKYFIKFGMDKNAREIPKHMCKDCFDLFNKFVEEVKRRLDEKDD